MEIQNNTATHKIGPFSSVLCMILGVDKETMRASPARDMSAARGLGLLQVFTWLYQTALFAVISHRLFAPAGELRPGLVLVSMFIATFILLIDSYMFMRSGWHMSGIEELKRGGIDVSGGPEARIKANCFLAIRIVLSIGLAQLTAIFLSLIVFGADIEAGIEQSYQAANAHLVADATAMADADIRRSMDAVRAQDERVDALSRQLTELRQNDIDPVANDAQTQQAQREVNELMAEKTKADNAVLAAQDFAAMELGGVKASAGNSGVVGNGPRYKAAREAAGNARSHAQEVGAALDAARSRLEALRKEVATASQAKEQRSHGELPGYEATLSAEEAKLKGLKAQLAGLNANRDKAIRDAVENAPDYAPLNKGFLAQIVALEHIAAEDRKIATVIVLIDLVSFGFELAAVLAKVLSYVPTTYSALLAKDAYMSAIRIVDEIVAEIKAANDNERRSPPDNKPANDNGREGGSSSGSDPFGSQGNVAPPKRKRGRPRKNPQQLH
jgi:hypothetical protein